MRSASLAARLLTLVVVPIVALSVLSVQRIGTERHTAAQAERLVDVVGLQQSVATLYPLANLERIALAGLARIDEIGVPRPLVVTLSDVDLEAVYSDNAERLDAALDELDARYGEVRLAGGSSLADELRPVRAELATQRAKSARYEASFADVEAVFERLDVVLNATLDAAEVPSDLSTELTEHATQLSGLSAVLMSAGDYGQWMLHAMLAADATMASTDRAYATHLAYLDVFRSSLNADDGAQLDEVIAEITPFHDIQKQRPDGAAQVGATDPEYVRASTGAILALLDHLERLQQFSAAFHGRVALDVNAAAADARQRAEQTMWLLLAIIATTISLMAAVLWSILTPLGRLRTRANAINRGEIDLEPLHVAGPSDLRSLTHAMNEMVTTLHRVNREMTRLASGDVDPDAPAELPGAIGVSMRESVRRLALVTSQLQRSEQLASAIVTQAADAIWTVDRDGLIRTANDASGRLTRVAPLDQIGRNIHEFLGHTSGETSVCVPTGSSPKVLVAESTIDAGGEQVIAVIAHDISERSRFEERLAYQANHDALTGLPNRFAVLEHLEQLVTAGATDVAVLFVDLDTFKSVNDTHGHAVGDKVLTKVAATLTRCVRGEEFVGRLGGDEFVVIVRRFSQPADVVALGYRIIREIEQPQEHDGQVFVLSASVGVAIPGPDTPALDTIRHADNAVYQAKRRGRGRVELFDLSMQEQIEHEAAVELELRHAVRNGELVLHLQPVFDLVNGGVCGAEALVRWNRPDVGLVYPGDFIPVAERSSLIFEIERWVLTESCKRVAAWRRIDSECAYRIAVNISGRHLIEGDLLDDVDAALAILGSRPGDARTGADRDTAARGPRPRDQGARHPARPGHHDRRRRLRHRVLVDDVPAPPPDRRRQDRPQLRRGRRSTVTTRRSSKHC